MSHPCANPRCNRMVADNTDAIACGPCWMRVRRITRSRIAAATTPGDRCSAEAQALIEMQTLGLVG